MNEKERLAEYEKLGTVEEIKANLQKLEQLKARITRLNELSRKARCSLTDLFMESEVHI